MAESRIRLEKGEVGFTIHCADCDEILAKNVPSEKSIYYRAGEFARHTEECPGKVGGLGTPQTAKGPHAEA